MELRTMRYFLAVAREENMTRAAELLQHHQHRDDGGQNQAVAPRGSPSGDGKRVTEDGQDRSFCPGPSAILEKQRYLW